MLTIPSWSLQTLDIGASLRQLPFPPYSEGPSHPVLSKKPWPKFFEKPVFSGEKTQDRRILGPLFVLIGGFEIEMVVTMSKLRRPVFFKKVPQQPGL